MKTKLLIITLFASITSFCVADEDFYPKYFYGDAVLDSVVIKKGNSDYKIEYNSDVYRRRTKETSYHWNTETYTWDGLENTEFVYDLSGNMIWYEFTTWDIETQLWKNMFKEEVTYNADGHKMIVKNYRWNDIANTWDIEKEEYTYDSNGHEILCNVFEWNSETNTWDWQGKYESKYDGDGNLIEEVYYLWITGTQSWIESYRYEWNIFDTYRNGSLIWYEWDSETNTLRNQSKHEYTYDAEGHELKHITYNWDSQNNVWIQIQSKESIYNEHGDLESVGYGGSGYVQKYEYSYDANGKKTLKVYYSRTDETEDWNLISKIQYDYDEFGNLTLDDRYGWILEQNKWEPQWRGEWFYHYGETQDVMKTFSKNTKYEKLLHNGNLYILLDGHMYTVTGAEVK